MHTLTVKIAAADTLYVYEDMDEDGNTRMKESAFGHMWFSISDGSTTESCGFASDKSNINNITKDRSC